MTAPQAGGPPPGVLVRAIRTGQRALRRIVGATGREELAELRHHIKILREAVKRIERANRTLTAAAELQNKRLARLLEMEQQVSDRLGERGLGLRMRQVNEGVQALIRRLYINPAELSHPHALLVQRFSILSQNGEDGLTWSLFRLIGATSRRFVEIGSGVNGGNSGFLAAECGWTGFMVDASEDRIERVRARFGRSVRAAACWVTRENINDLVTEHGLAGEVDLFSIDIDGNEYWVWEALTACSPRVVIVEYNAWFGPDRAVVVPYDPQFDRHRVPDPRYYGGSLAALTRLGVRKGYRLVVTEPRGVNAYFLREDVYPALPACEPATVFRFAQTARRTDDIFSSVARHGLPLIDVTA